MRGVERRRDHVIQLEIRLQRRAVDIEFGLPALLRVVVPVPGGQGLVMTFRLRHACQRFALLVGSKLGSAPHPFQKLARGGRRLRHRVVDLVIRVSLEAEELREFASQCQNFLDKRAIIGSRFLAARDVGFVGLLPADRGVPKTQGRARCSRATG